MFKSKTLLIVGGTGSFGNAVLQRFLKTDIKLLRYRERFPQKGIFSGEWGGKFFMGKGIRRVGVELADYLNRVPIPQKRTFSVEV